MLSYAGWLLHPGAGGSLTTTVAMIEANTSAVSPDESLLEQELREAVDAAIAQLPETQRMAVILRRYEELSYEEIAETLDQSVSAVKSLLFRARTELREHLKRYLSA